MAGKTHLKKRDIRNIRRFLDILKKQKVEVLRAILFGSYARGNADSDSDIDIVIVSRQFGEDTAEEMMFLRKLAVQVDSHIEPVPLSPEDFEDHYSTFIQEIKRYGKDLEKVV